MNETLLLPPWRFIFSQGNTCKQKELRATRKRKAVWHDNATPGRDRFGLRNQERPHRGGGIFSTEPDEERNFRLKELQKQGQRDV